MSIDWSGLLAWSTKYHDGTAPSKFNTMSQEDRVFLQNATASAMAMIEDLNQVLTDGLAKLKEAQGMDEYVVALEVIERCIDDPDCCRNLEKFGGVEILLNHATTSESEEVRDRCCDILALMVANNEELQASAVTKGALDILTKIEENEENKEGGYENKEGCYSKSRLKLLGAIVRGHPEIENLFVKRGGLEWLCRAFSASAGAEKGGKGVEKAMSFLRHLMIGEPVRCHGRLTSLLGAIVNAYKGLSEDDSVLQYAEIIAAVVSVLSEQLATSVCEKEQPENEEEDAGPKMSEVTRPGKQEPKQEPPLALGNAVGSSAAGSAARSVGGMVRVKTGFEQTNPFVRNGKVTEGSAAEVIMMLKNRLKYTEKDQDFYSVERKMLTPALQRFTNFAKI